MSRPLLSPPALFFLSILTMEAFQILAPGPRLVAAPFNLVGALLVATGVWLHVRATRLFRRHQTTLATLEAPRVLVTQWPFSLTRNPMYLAGVLILLGIGLFLGTTLPLAVPPLFGYLAHNWYIRPEEVLLEREFGESYQAYARGVRAWI